MIPHAWRRAAAALSLLWLATLAGAAMTFLAQVLLARRLGPHEFGLFASSLVTVMMLAPLAGFGLTQFRLRAYGEEGWGADRWSRPSLRFSTATTVIAIGIIAIWALTGPGVNAETRDTLLVLSPSVVGLLAVELVGSKLRLEERYLPLAGWQLLTPAGRLTVASLVLAIPAANAPLVALGYCMVALTTIVLAAPQVRAMLRGTMDLRGHGPRIAPTPASPGVTALWSQAWPYGLSAVLYPVFFQISTVLLKYLGDDAQAGRYGIAMAVMTAIYLLPTTVYQKFLLSKLHRWAVHDRRKFWQVHRLGSRWMLVAGVAIGALLAALAPWAVPLAFGEQYRGAVAPLMVLAVCVPIRFLSNGIESALLTQGQMHYRLAAMAMAAVAALALNALLIPRYAEIGAASATIVAETVLLLAMVRGVRRMPRPQDE